MTAKAPILTLLAPSPSAWPPPPPALPLGVARRLRAPLPWHPGGVHYDDAGRHRRRNWSVIIVSRPLSAPPAVSYSVTRPRLLRLPSSSDDPTEYFLTCLHLLVNVGMALKDLVLAHKAAATTRGLAKRVATLIDALEATVPAPPSTSTQERPPRAARSAPVQLAAAAFASTGHAISPEIAPGHRLTRESLLHPP